MTGNGERRLDPWPVAEEPQERFAHGRRHRLLPLRLSFAILRKTMRGPIKKPTRLGLWTGPQLQPRGQHSWLTALCQREVFVRASIVVATVALLATLAYGWGLPLPYRIGEVCPHDVLARIDFSVIDPAR